VAPFAASVPIACTSLSTDFRVTKADANDIKNALASGHDTWRLGDEQDVADRSLAEALSKWNVVPSPGLKLQSCSKPMVVDGTQFAWCNWSDSNSMQRFSIQLTRFSFLRHRRKWDTAPWILTRGDGLHAPQRTTE
jgi:hypothetical protein